MGGPFVVNVTAQSATVVWLTENASGGGALRVEKTVMKGLSPNQRYEYDAAGEDEGKGSFKTPPAGEEPYRFVVYGDTRSRHELHRRVIQAMIARGAPDFVVHTGDLVADGNDNSQWPVFFDIERDLLRQTVFFPALGNHERNSPEYYQYFQVTKPYYSFDWGNGHFIVLNSDVENVAENPATRDAFWAEQTRWLEDDLASHQNAVYRFVIAHHPPFTAVARRQNENPRMTALVPLFEKYRVTAGFFGHDHNYQRYLKNGVHYLITGGGGAPLYDVDKPPQGITQKVASTEHFVTVSVEGKKARIEAITLDGRELDEVEIGN